MTQEPDLRLAAQSQLGGAGRGQVWSTFNSLMTQEPDLRLAAQSQLGGGKSAYFESPGVGLSGFLAVFGPWGSSWGVRGSSEIRILAEFSAFWSPG